MDGVLAQQQDYNPVLETIHETTPLYEDSCGDYDPESMREKVRRSLCMSHGAAEKYLADRQKPPHQDVIYSHDIPRTYVGWANDYRLYGGSLTPSPAPSSGPSHTSTSSCQSSTAATHVEITDFDCPPRKTVGLNDNYLSVSTSQTTPLITPQAMPIKSKTVDSVITPRETETIVSNIEKLLIEETL